MVADSHYTTPIIIIEIKYTLTMGNKERKQRYFAKKLAEAETITCACGCGTQMKAVDNYARPRKFVSGHNTPRKYEDPKQFKREWNHRNKLHRQEAKKLRFRRLKVKLIELFGGGCQLCKITYNGSNASIFHFHHTNPFNKSFALGNQLNNKAWHKIMAEANKCIMICANCHEQQHSGSF